VVYVSYNFVSHEDAICYFDGNRHVFEAGVVIVLHVFDL